MFAKLVDACNSNPGTIWCLNQLPGKSMRKWHRWVSLLSSVIMGFIAATGLLLQLDWYFGGRTPPSGLGEPPGGPRPAEAAPAPGGAPLAVAAAVAPPAPGGGPGAPGGEGGATQGWIKGYKSLHNVLQNLHAGYFMGTFGRWLSIAMATGLFALSITGIVMYVQLYGARKKLGRSGLFWH